MISPEPGRRAADEDRQKSGREVASTKRRPYLVYVRLNCNKKKLCLLADGVHGACINTGAAVDTFVSVDRSFAVCFSDCAYRTGVVACSTVDAFIGNGMSQFVHLPHIDLPAIFSGPKNIIGRNKSPEERFARQRVIVSLVSP